MSKFIRKLSVNIKGKSTSSTPGDQSPRDRSPGPASAEPASAHSPISPDRSRPSNVDSLAGRASESRDRANGHDGTKRSIDLIGARRSLAGKFHLPGRSPSRSSADIPKNRDGNDMSKNQLKKHSKQAETERRSRWHERQSADLRRRREREMQLAENEDSPEMRARYGWLPVNRYAGSDVKPTELMKLADFTDDSVGKEVYFRCRVHYYRKMSAKLAFFLLRQQTLTIQGVLQESDKISHHMVHWGEHIPLETIVEVRGIVQQPKVKEGEVTGAVIRDKEILIQDMKVVSSLTEHTPFSVYEAEVSELEAAAEGSSRHHISDRTRLNGRVIDLRTTTSQAIFRIQSGIGGLFRGFLDTKGFIEIHSPKLQGGATESGASVFKVDYFGRAGFLAQSPQLAKQMCISADMGRVYEVGPVFRAENSNTHRHLTEYTGLDIEMQIDEHYHEALRMVDNTLKHIFEGVYKRYPKEIELIKHQFPHEDLVWLEKTPVLPFREAITMLNETGWKGEDGKPLPLDEDLGTRDEIQLGRVVKEKYKTDYYIMDKFPASARPFYTMPDPENSAYTNSFDVFVRGQEIISGGQRVHDAGLLREQMLRIKMDPTAIEDYMQAFEWAAPPHAGAGVGLERITMLLLQLGDIRHASLYPRDPKSLPEKPAVVKLRHPEASTMHPPWEGTDRAAAHEDLQPLEKLIANYGDASNTSWLEERTNIFRESDTGAAVGYVPHSGYAIAVGDPLCHQSQYAKVIASFMDFLKHETSLKPLWLLCGTETQDVLGERFDWRTFSCAAEQRLDLRAGSESLKAFQHQEIQRKIRRTDKEGIKIKTIEMGETIPADFKAKIDKRIEDWLGGRKSHQHVHLTDVHPWQDVEHREFHYAVDQEGTIHCLVIMAQLAPAHGWQVKFSLDFPDAPNGAIEACIVHALNAVRAKGEEHATFGGGASNNFLPGHNLKGVKVRMLQKAYTTIATDLKLTAKSEFREKLGTGEDPIYVCYPPKGLGPKGVQAILSFFES